MPPNFFSDLMMGVSQASNQLPQAMAARQRLMMQQQELQRGQATQAFDMAQQTNDPSAMEAAWQGMLDSGAVPPVPEVPRGEMPFEYSPEITGYEPPEVQDPRLTAMIVSGIMTEEQARIKREREGLTYTSEMELQEARRKKLEEEVSNSQENRRLKEEQINIDAFKAAGWKPGNTKGYMYRSFVKPDGGIGLEYKKVDFEVSLQEGTRYNKILNIHRKTLKYISPEQALANFLADAAKEQVTVTDKDEGRVKEEFAQSLFQGIKIEASLNEKLAEDRVIQKKASNVLRMIDRLSPEDKKDFGALEGRFEEKTFVITGGKERSEALDTVLVELMLMMEQFARRQTGAAITEDETRRFNLLSGAITMDVNAVKTRALGLIGFTNDMREAAYKNGLREKYPMGIPPNVDDVITRQQFQVRNLYPYLSLGQLNLIIDQNPGDEYAKAAKKMLAKRALEEQKKQKKKGENDVVFVEPGQQTSAGTDSVNTDGGSSAVPPSVEDSTSSKAASRELWNAYKATHQKEDLGAAPRELEILEKAINARAPTTTLRSEHQEKDLPSDTITDRTPVIKGWGAEADAILKKYKIRSGSELHFLLAKLRKQAEGV